MPILNTLDVQIGKNIARDFTGSQKDISAVYNDVALFMLKYRELDYLTNEFIAKDFTADGGNPQALRVTIRADREPASTLYSFQDVYNNGDVAAFEDATLGQITYLVSFSDAAIGTALGVSASITAWIEFTYLDGNGYPSTLLTKQITIYNEVDDGAPGTPPPTSPTYLTAAEIAAAYVANGDVMFWGVQSATTTAPPTLTGSGDKYIVPTGATGAWVGQEGKIAVDDSSWTYYTPVSAWTATVLDDLTFQQYSGTAWIPLDGGLSIPHLQVAHTFTVGMPIYNNAGTWAKAKADDANTLGIAIVTQVVDADNFKYKTMGPWLWTAHGYTQGEYLLVSAATAGALTATTPAGIADYSNPIMYVLSADIVFIFPWRPFQAIDRSNDRRNVTITVADSPYDVTDLDEVIFANAVGGAIIINLPTPSASYDNFLETIKKIDVTANTVTVKCASGNIDLVAGTTGHVMSVPLDSRDFNCDATDYWII